MSHIYKYLSALLLLCGSSQAQIGIGTTTPAGALDVTSTTNGVLIPRVALTSKAVSAPVVNPQGGPLTAGTLIWNTATAGTAPNNVVPGFYYWSGSAWVQLGTGTTNNWAITGNAGTNGGTTTTAGTNFIGTTDNQNLDIRTNNTYMARFSRLGEFFVGTYNTVIAGDLMNAVGNTTFPWAVNGYTAFDGAGVYGSVTSGTSGYGAIQGEYYGSSGQGNGVRGINASSTAGAGVYGLYGGSAASGIRTGVKGYSSGNGGNQLVGVSGEYDPLYYGIGVAGIGFGGAIPAGNYDFGVLGWVGGGFNFSGYFNGNHVVANGTKSASVGTSKGNQLLYVAESPEVWFEDIGRAKLVNGYAEVKLDPLFLETVFIDDAHPMSVFLQEEGESNGLYVIPGKDGFIVKEKNGGQSNISFSYRIMAKRLHFQDHRFGSDPIWGNGDTRQYNRYVPPPKIDYNENIQLQEERRKSHQPDNLPPGFVRLDELQKDVKNARRVKKTN